MSVVVLVEFTIKPDQVDAYLIRLRNSLVETRGAPGFEDIRVLQDREAPNRLVAVERWRSREDQESYIAWRQSSGMSMDPFAEPFRFRYLDEIPMI